ncbi:MAG: aerobic-type carbon monoxide dehydrogenase, large subunit CoxL/CutL-like protein [Candidatus Angelobacter sp.]|jgi:xanthine dehydrogenase YagR molybdenum-binding subunit|nr:aerobic-type carbon monoxide dehydrogenase, large subunit CoxL/CutL-like protein [Candidatus Angelobacter sp.]
MTTNYIGQPISRVDGRAKVTGQAKYAGEYNVPNLAYGVVVSSAIAKGRIAEIDASAALGLKGVLQVFTHKNAPPTAKSDQSYWDEVAVPGSPFRPFKDDKLLFSGQPIALVVAESFELARYAASLVQVEYEPEAHATDLNQQRDKAYKPKPREGVAPPPPPRGNPDKAFANSAVQIDAEYSVPAEHHNPMEPFATTVIWEADGRLTVYDKTQGTPNSHQYVCNVFGLSPDDVHLLSPYVGGGFGSGLRPKYQLFLAVMAARGLKRSVRVTLTRQQMFTIGHRPRTLQRVALGAAKDGKLEALIHEALAETSQFEEYSEPVVQWSGELYKCENVKLDHALANLDINTPVDMRAPGATWGLYALESAMDELAYKLNMDPLELRLKNYAEKDFSNNKPFSSKELKECFRQGAERFGWSKRTPEPRSMRDGGKLVGWGLATGIWETTQLPAGAKAVLTAEGKLTVGSATADIGTGTYTIMTQIAAESLGLPIEDVTFTLGDSTLPRAPVEGGSFTAASVGSAVKQVCDKIREKLVTVAKAMPKSPLANAKSEEIAFADGRMMLTSGPSRYVSIKEVMRHGGLSSIAETADSTPDFEKQSKYSIHPHSAIFAEVKVDEDLGTIDVLRVVSAIAGGRILNPKTARSQIMGGIVWGIGMALEEESVIDQKFGRFMNHNLAEYHVPVNADVQNIDVIFVEEHDSIVNPLGIKGLGEIGIVGTGAAIGNAIFHATGVRVRDLPITLDKVFAGAAAARPVKLAPAA